MIAGSIPGKTQTANHSVSVCCCRAPESLDRAYRFGLDTLNKDPTIPREAIVSMVRLMADLGLIDRAAAASTSTEAFYDKSFVEVPRQQRLWA